MNKSHLVYLQSIFPTLLDKAELQSSVELPLLIPRKEPRAQYLADQARKVELMELYREIRKKNAAKARRLQLKETAEVLLAWHKSQAPIQIET